MTLALDGGEGNDTIIGSADNDALVGGNGSDNFAFDSVPAAVT